jgi:hypothetical protein
LSPNGSALKPLNSPNGVPVLSSAVSCRSDGFQVRITSAAVNRSPSPTA